VHLNGNGKDFRFRVRHANGPLVHQGRSGAELLFDDYYSGDAQTVAAQELRIECMFPADDETAIRQRITEDDREPLLLETALMRKFGKVAVKTRTRNACRSVDLVTGACPVQQC